MPSRMFTNDVHAKRDDLAIQQDAVDAEAGIVTKLDVVPIAVKSSSGRCSDSSSIQVGM
ncbi:uncharacterized protein RCC_06165 [Ramularia collo-cygni]|uniref:Uncharacterized protein n=1 Tax=Ramularia collo-cygni TaxID=112498 RepID=A0A2D3V9I0_9PEZI|nr:uncharacterized protein RCC_06165 [Ramularia collo-cygni]CZT20306.1 uncharacterized protein RCC_06165 [Ramularia collo-cygni]